MCNGWVRRIVRWDKKKQFSFSPLEGETAKKVLTPLLPGYIEENTIVFYDEGEVLLRSDAALRIMRILGLPFSLLLPGYFIPKGIRDGIYRWVANRRYRYGERYDACPLPPIAWRDRFI